MTKKTLLLNATILLPQLVVAQSAELNEAYKKYYGEYENCKISKDSPNILLITSDQHGWQWDIMILNVKLLIWTDWQVKESFSIKPTLAIR